MVKIILNRLKNLPKSKLFLGVEVDSSSHISCGPRKTSVYLYGISFNVFVTYLGLGEFYISFASDASGDFIELFKTKGFKVFGSKSKQFECNPSNKNCESRVTYNEMLTVWTQVKKLLPASAH